MNQKNIILTIKITILIIAGFIVITALYGGMHLILDPTGQSIKLDQHLDKINFVENYRMLGYLLIFVIGLVHFASIVFLLKNNNYAGIIVVITAGGLLVWTCVQLFTIGWFYHSILYLILSLIEIILGVIYYLIFKNYIKTQSATTHAKKRNI